ncbi:hypothetical protein GM708_17720 [Vibrio cholerae]|nr:hypothetical protein [Vibrio cholerae]
MRDCEDGGMHGGKESLRQNFQTRMPWVYRLGVLTLGGVVTVGVAWGMVARGVSGAAFVAFLLTVVFLSVALMQVTVKLEPTGVSVRVAGIFATYIPYHQIDEVGPDRPTGIAADMGVRMLPGSTTGYLVGGPSVRITIGCTSVLVSSDAPEELSDAIRAASSSSTS